VAQEISAPLPYLSRTIDHKTKPRHEAGFLFFAFPFNHRERQHKLPFLTGDYGPSKPSRKITSVSVSLAVLSAVFGSVTLPFTVAVAVLVT